VLVAESGSRVLGARKDVFIREHLVTRDREPRVRKRQENLPCGRFLVCGSRRHISAADEMASGGESDLNLLSEAIRDGSPVGHLRPRKVYSPEQT
jgi:hypothetical protein